MLSIQSIPLLCYEYDEVFYKAKDRLNCIGVDIYESLFSVNNIETLLSHLIFNESQEPSLRMSRLSYQMIGCCCEVNERKARQIVIMLCRALGKSNISIDRCSRNVFYLMLKLCFGNFFEKNLLIKLFDVMYFTYKNFSVSHKNTVADVKKQLCEILPFVLDSETQISFSNVSVKDFIKTDSSTIDCYNNLLTLLSSFLEGCVVGIDDAVVCQEVYDDDFYDILDSTVQHMQLSLLPIKKEGLLHDGFDISLFARTIQLASSYLGILSDQVFIKYLSQAELSSIHVLFFNVLLSRNVVCNIDKLYDSAYLEHPLLICKNLN